MRFDVFLLVFLCFFSVKLYQKNLGVHKSTAYKVVSAKCIIEPSIETKKENKKNDSVLSKVTRSFNPFPYPCDSLTGVFRSTGRHLNKKIKKLLK